MASVPSSPIQVIENRHGKTRVAWESDRSGNTKYYKLYWNSRKSGAYVFLREVSNAIGYSNIYVMTEIDRSILTSGLVSIGNEDNYYLTLNKVDWDGNETPFMSSYKKIVYPDGVTLSNSYVLQDVDHQPSLAANVDFTSSDRFEGALQSVYVYRDIIAPIDIKVSLIPAPDLVLADEKNWVKGVYELDLKNKFPQFDGRDVRVQVTNVPGGVMTVTIGRKRLFVPPEAW
jgi:hypothetical protein